jgi:hypothetical protein
VAPVVAPRAQVTLVVAVQMDLERLSVGVVAVQQLRRDVRLSAGRHQRGDPVFGGEDAVYFGLGLHDIGPPTHSLKHLEDVLGIPLFDRQGVTPTVFGELMLNHGEPVIKGFADLLREIDLAKGLEIGEFSVSAGPYPAEIWGQRALGVLSARHPRLFVELKLFNWTKIVNRC